MREKNKGQYAFNKKKKKENEQKNTKKCQK